MSPRSLTARAVACLATVLFPGVCALFAGGGVIATAPGQPGGALSGRIVFTSAGHGWTFNNSSGAWSTQRGELHEMVEDYGNLDQMNFFAAYCFNAGATVVAFRPIGYQTNEVVLDNTAPAVRFNGSWSNSSATNTYFGRPGEVPYRFAGLAATESATAVYTPTIPAAGFYPVYTWVAHGGNRTSQLYLINHTGGQGRVRVPHHMVGNGWVYLGTYYFETGSNALSGSVAISNLQPTPTVGTVVVADAIRFGNGRGSVRPERSDSTPGPVSGYPREEECARYWVQNMLGVGMDTGLYDTPGSSDANDNVGTPPRTAREMNRCEAGSRYQRVFLSFHSNASGSPTPTARGCVGLYNNPSLFPGTATSNQFRLAELTATEMNARMAAQTNLEVPWSSRSGASLTFARTDFAFGEINNNAIDDEFDATILEVAFHDNPDDASLLRDPKAREVMGRATCQGIVRYMGEFGGVPVTFIPDPPTNLRAVATGTGGIVVAWSQSGFGGSPATGYVVYRSTNGFGFGQPVALAGATTTSITFSNLAPDLEWYFRVAATNAGGESMPSETVGCRWSSRGDRPVLFVNGYDRYDRTIAPRQTVGPGISGSSATFERVIPRLFNSFDYVVPHGQAMGRSGVPFDSCQNEGIIGGSVRLTNYLSVIWGLGRESTADETFSSTEQTRVTEFLNRGGRLFVSGVELAWDLDRASGPTAADRAFLHNQLHVALNGDTNDDAGTHTFAAVTGGIFTGNPAGRFDDGTAGIYEVAYPDILTPVGPNAVVALNYTGGRGGSAAVQNLDPATGARVVCLGFPFEAITDPNVRDRLMFDVLAWFGAVPAPTPTLVRMSMLPPVVGLEWASRPGRKYRVEFKDNLGGPGWTPAGADFTATGSSVVFTIGNPAGNRRFFRVLMVD